MRIIFSLLRLRSFYENFEKMYDAIIQEEQILFCILYEDFLFICQIGELFDPLVSTMQ